VTELADSYIGLQTRFHITDPGRADFVRIRSDLVQAVKERFDAEGIDMPYPVRTLEGDLEIDGELATSDGGGTAATADD
jgi:small-conductance mechanosensitive channel